jgi:hypothetical protein
MRASLGRTSASRLTTILSLERLEAERDQTPERLTGEFGDARVSRHLQPFYPHPEYLGRHLLEEPPR